MKKYLHIIILATLSYFNSNAQVGIGTTDPKALLDLTVKDPANSSITDGILIPRINEFPNSDPSTDQDGMLVFITGNGSNPDSPVKGLYYWHSSNKNWTTLDHSSTKGLRYYSWDTANDISQPDINTIRSTLVTDNQGRNSSSDLDSTLRNRINPGSDHRLDGYIIQLIGVFIPDISGNYEFEARSDDGSKILVDDVMVVNNWEDRTTRTDSAVSQFGSIELIAGEKYKIEFWYYKRATGNTMEFKWGTNPSGYAEGSFINANQFFVK